MPKKILSYIGSFVGLGMFIIAMVVLHGQLKAWHYHELIRTIGHLPPAALLAALGFSALNYMILSVYELLGFRYVGHRLPWYRVVFTSFISYAFSNNVGFYTISGSAVRFRLYSQFGLSAIEITKLILFVNGAAFWLGLCAINSIVFLLVPFSGPLPPVIPAASPHIIGVVFGSILVTVLIAAALRKKSIRFRQWEFELPSVPLLSALILTACLDWLLCAGALYVLLPAHAGISFPAFTAVFLLAMLAGLVSHVPGGLGVFESTMLLLLPHESSGAVFTALLAFRAIYYLLPLGAASGLLGSFELLQHRKKITDALYGFGRLGTGVIPYFYAALTFIGGLVLLFSGATPARHHRLNLLIEFLPLPMLELSHFMASVFGTGLILLAWGLYRRLDAAWHATLLLFLGGIVFSLLKGLDYEEAVIMTVLGALLVAGRSNFYRTTALTGDRFSPGWLLMVGMALVSTFWLGMFSYKHVQYANELWWKFGLHNNAPRFMRAMVGSMATVFTVAMYQFFRPALHRPSGTAPGPLPAAVRPIVEASPSTTAWLAFLGDKRFLFDDKESAFIMYGIEGRSWIAMGDPVGNPAAFSALVWKFRELCDRSNGRPVFYEVSSDNLPLYLDLGLTLLKVGEEGRVPLAGFTLEGGARKSLRHTLHRLEQDGCSFAIVTREQSEENLPVLKTISDAWLEKHRAREKRFSLGYFNEPYLRETPFAVVRDREKIVAFANIWASADGGELSVDLMRFSESAPKNSMDFLFGNLMLWGSRNGYSRFNLGMAPFSGFESHSLAPFWNRLGALLYRHGDNFYNFQGLRRYKEKFDPVWQPRYLAVPPGFSLPLIIKDISGLISGGLKGVFAK